MKRSKELDPVETETVEKNPFIVEAVPPQIIMWAQSMKKYTGVPFSWMLIVCAVETAYGKTVKGLYNYFNLTAGEGSPATEDGYAWYGGGPVYGFNHFCRACKQRSEYAQIFADYVNDHDAEKYVCSMIEAWTNDENKREALMKVFLDARYNGKSLIEIETM